MEMSFLEEDTLLFGDHAAIKDALDARAMVTPQRLIPTTR